MHLRNVSRIRAPLHSGATAPFCCAVVGVTPAGCSTATAGDAAAAHEVTMSHTRTMHKAWSTAVHTICDVQEHERCHLL